MSADAGAVVGVARRGVDHTVFVVASRLVAIAAIVVVLSILSPHFLSWGNFVNVLRQASLQFLIASLNGSSTSRMIVHPILARFTTRTPSSSACFFDSEAIM